MIFYDPHPGKLGASIPLPDIIRIIADNMNGKKMELIEAVQTIKDAANDLVADGTFEDAEVQLDQDCIILMLTDDSEIIHIFRIIRFKESK